MKKYTEEYLRTQIGRKMRCLLRFPRNKYLIIYDCVLGESKEGHLSICQNVISGRCNDNDYGYKYLWAFTFNGPILTDLELL